jgi:hypothetical protein
MKHYTAIALFVATSALFAVLELRGGCPFDVAAEHMQLSSESGHFTIEGVTYNVGVSALLDYMPRTIETPADRLAFAMRGERHPLTVVASVSSSRDALGDPTFTCVRATRGSEVWMARPTTYGTQTSTDGYPPGAPSPPTIEAWRLAVASGPEWRDGDQVRLELFLTVRGKRYVIAFPPFSLMRGG